MRGAFRLFSKLGIDGRRQIACTVYAVHSFFDAYLKGTGARRSNSIFVELQAHRRFIDMILESRLSGLAASRIALRML